MTKQDEIDLLGSMVAKARAINCDYLADTLEELLPSFTRDIRSDTCMTTQDMRAAKKAMEEEIGRINNQLLKLKEERDELTKEVDWAKRLHSEVRSKLKNALTSLEA